MDSLLSCYIVMPSDKSPSLRRLSVNSVEITGNNETCVVYQMVFEPLGKLALASDSIVACIPSQVSTPSKVPLQHCTSTAVLINCRRLT